MRSKLQTYQNIATKPAHTGVLYLTKESSESIEICIRSQDGDFSKYTGSLTFSSSKSTHLIHK